MHRSSLLPWGEGLDRGFQHEGFGWWQLGIKHLEGVPGYIWAGSGLFLFSHALLWGWQEWESPHGEGWTGEGCEEMRAAGCRLQQGCDEACERASSRHGWSFPGTGSCVSSPAYLWPWFLWLLITRHSHLSPRSLALRSRSPHG